MYSLLHSKKNYKMFSEIFSDFFKKVLTKDHSCVIIYGRREKDVIFMPSDRFEVLKGLDSLAQLVEHMTFNHGVRSSTLR